MRFQPYPSPAAHAEVSRRKYMHTTPPVTSASGKHKTSSSINEHLATVRTSSGHPMDLTPNSLYITTRPSDLTEFSWALVTTDANGLATRYAWSKRRPGTVCPSPNHLVVAPAGHKINGDIQPAQVVNIQALHPPSSITNGRVNLAYFHIDGYFPSLCIDGEGKSCFDSICHSIYTMSFANAKMNRESGMTSQAWVMSVLNQLENIGCIIRGMGKLVVDLEEEVLEKSRIVEKEYDDDLREHTTLVVDL